MLFVKVVVDISVDGTIHIAECTLSDKFPLNKASMGVLVNQTGTKLACGDGIIALFQ